MKTFIHINFVVFIVYVCMITHKTYSFSLHSREATEEFAEGPYSNVNSPSSLDGYELMKNPLLSSMHGSFNQRRSDSAEKYFGWASKTNRPMEYLRGKRFWLFTKKDEQGLSQELLPNAGQLPNSLSQGIWRSGIVGRRRR